MLYWQTHRAAKARPQAYLWPGQPFVSSWWVAIAPDVGYVLCVCASGYFLPGSQASQGFIPGAQRAQAYIPGAQAAQGGCGC